MVLQLVGDAQDDVPELADRILGAPAGADEIRATVSKLSNKVKIRAAARRASVADHRVCAVGQIACGFCVADGRRASEEVSGEAGGVMAVLRQGKT